MWWFWAWLFLALLVIGAVVTIGAIIKKVAEPGGEGARAFQKLRENPNARRELKWGIVIIAIGVPVALLVVERFDIVPWGSEKQDIAALAILLTAVIVALRIWDYFRGR